MFKFNNNLGFKNKVKWFVVGFAVAVSLSYLFVGFMLNGWITAVDLTSQLFYQESKTITVSVDHKEKLSVETMIKKTFGKDANMALAISHAENGTRQCDRFHVNNDKSIDVGIFQINSVHMVKGYTLKDLSDCKKNIEIAHNLYLQQGWTPWTVYQNKSYLKFL